MLSLALCGMLALATIGRAFASGDSATGTIVLTARDKDGNPVPNAFVTENINIEMNAHYFADARGQVVLTVTGNVAMGRICANSGGTSLSYYGSTCIDHLVVAPGATLAVDLVLLPASSTPTPQPSVSAPLAVPSPSPAPPLSVPAGAATRSSATAPASCRFVLGFQALHDLLPAVVGDCLDDERHSPENGDGMQHTTKGLLVWRKADNLTAFTDGYRTWVNDPQGVRQRLNTQRFAWEANPDGLPVVP